MLGYSMLAWAFWYALDMRPRNRWFAWLLAILYAITDEYHQSFVTGRYPSVWDVIVFDNLGALISIWLLHLYQEKRPTQLTVDHVEA